MIESLLIANRGEIACRVIKTARRLGVRTIAIYSDVDADALHVQLADEAVCVGPARATESYLAIDKVIAAAQERGAQAIHPGYGFLSENADFARACEAAGVVFVGPPASAIESMGSKTEAKRLMEAASVPILPGYHGDAQDAESLAQFAADVGYPLLIKASAGGGGKGMRLVEDPDAFESQLEGAKRESAAAFGDDTMLLERYLTAPKHIEVQVMADTHGNVLHLFERDCSVQRRHQKVVEEAPGPTITPEMRDELGTAAVMAAQKVGYVGAGTVEFIAEGDSFYFMEMNTRLQVEHPVTEAITGLDLVELQLQVASGEPLPITQDDLAISGHAIEVRLYAENPGKRFLPSTGKLEHFEISDAIRVDTGVKTGDEVSMHYDPMLAKLIAHGATREGAIAQLIEALDRSAVAGVEHNLGYLRRMLDTEQFRAGDYTTGLADSVHDEVVPDFAREFAVLAVENQLADRNGFRLNLPSRRVMGLRQGKKELEVVLQDGTAEVNGEPVEVRHNATVLRRGDTLFVMAHGHTERFVDLTDDISRFQKQLLSQGGVVAPMPGQVIAVNVAVGDSVKVGDVLVVVEAMKMEHGVVATKSGKVTDVLCSAGDKVEEGVPLVELE